MVVGVQGERLITVSFRLLGSRTAYAVSHTIDSKAPWSTPRIQFQYNSESWYQRSYISIEKQNPDTLARECARCFNSASLLSGFDSPDYLLR